MDGPGRASVGVMLVAILVCTAIIVAGTAGVATASEEGNAEFRVDQSGTGGTGVNQTANNSTQHENPDATGEDGNLDAITGWLIGQMAEDLLGSTLQLSQSEYELAREYVGDDYNDKLAKFVDVAGETEGTEDDETGETLEETQDNQQEFTSTVQEYRTTLEEYREAQRNGNTTRARTLARELDSYARTVTGTGVALQDNYDTIENRSGRDLSEASRVITSITENITAQQAEIRSNLFVETDLQVEPLDREISFRSPLELDGTLRTANGTPLSDREITLRIGNRTVTTRTDSAGRFTVQYRPVSLRTGPLSLIVQYRPENASVYLGDRATVSVQVRQVTPDLTVSRTPATAGYGDAVTISGTVRTNTTGVPAVPMVIVLDGQRLGVARTDADGSFAVEASLPATVAVGEAPVKASVAFEDRAIGATNASTSLRVRSTPTRLSVNVTETTAGQVSVQGQLLTRTGEPVAGQGLSLLVNGTVVETVGTENDGRFAHSIEVPQALREGQNSTVQVRAVFDGAGTNLNGSEDEVLVTLPPGGGSGANDPGSEGGGGESTTETVSPGDSDDSIVSTVREWLRGDSDDSIVSTVREWLPGWLWLLLGVGGIVLLVGLGGVVALRRRRAGVPDEETGGSEEVTVERDAREELSVIATEKSVYEEAVGRLEAGDPDGAVEYAYRATRATLLAHLSIDGTQTHWEFLTACRSDSLDEDQLAALENLTEAYEQAAFAPTPIDRDRARTIVERVGEPETTPS
jgi:hypothetical protein